MMAFLTEFVHLHLKSMFIWEDHLEHKCPQMMISHETMQLVNGIPFFSVLITRVCTTMFVGFWEECVCVCVWWREENPLLKVVPHGTEGNK